MSVHQAISTETDSQSVVWHVAIEGVKQSADLKRRYVLQPLKLLAKTIVLGLFASLCPFGIPFARAQTAPRAQLSARQIAQQDVSVGGCPSCRKF
jgi:hypothetical protein